MPFQPTVARALTRLLGGGASRDRVARLAYADAGHGFDAFGMHPDFVALGDALAGKLYDHWFRVHSYDSHHIPATGPAILAANHSGSLPFDAMMLWIDVLRHTTPPRAPRAVADYFVSSLPFIGTLFSRAGMVGGSRGNVRRLLEQGSLLMLFPEGTEGIGKHFSERYQLQEWRQGHCEMSIRFRAPVIPVGIVGAEEQMPQITRIPLAPLGLPIPFVPVPVTPIPLPVRYHVIYGEPLRFDLEYQPEDADDPDVLASCAARVKAAVEGLLHRGLAQREGVFA
jgi:1-acyl-sn-glycerol-3-phosphate acyltransferase